MTPRLFPSREGLEWLRIAARDIRLAELALADSQPLAGEALYHAQQAAEEALKGFLVVREAPYPLNHDIRKLLEFCEKLDPKMAPAAGLTHRGYPPDAGGPVGMSREADR